MSRWSLDEPFGMITCEDLRRCIDEGQLQLNYQPVICPPMEGERVLEHLLRSGGIHYASWLT